MIDADTIKQTIIEFGRKSQSPVSLEKVARELDMAHWQEILESVRLVAEVMELQGLIRLSDDKIIYAARHDPSQNT